MYLVDTNVISEIRKHANANKGIREFFNRLLKNTTYTLDKHNI